MSGLGASYIVSVGNETCLDALDALKCLVEQEDVRVVALYIEGLADAARILLAGFAAGCAQGLSSTRCARCRSAATP